MLAILYCLDDLSLINWVKQELAGYDKDIYLPKYRKLKGILMTSYFVGYMQYPRRPFGITHLDKDLQDKLLRVDISSSISILEEAKHNKECTIIKSITPEFFGIISENSNANIISSSVDIDLGSINDIVSKVKTKNIRNPFVFRKRIWES